MFVVDLFAVVSTVAAVREDGLRTNPILRYCEETPVRPTHFNFGFHTFLMAPISNIQDKKDSWRRKLLVRFFMYPTWLRFIRHGLLWGMHGADSLLVWYVFYCKLFREPALNVSQGSPFLKASSANVTPWKAVRQGSCPVGSLLRVTTYSRARQRTC